MKDMVVLPIDGERVQFGEIEKLQEALALCGVKVESNTGNVYFNFDADELARIRYRGAGRKSIMSKRLISEVYLYALEHTAAETAAYAGMSLRTYQRNVAKCKAGNKWTDDENLLYFGL